MQESELLTALRSLAIARPLLRRGPVRRLADLLQAVAQHCPLDTTVDAWAAYASSLLPHQLSLEAYLRDYFLHAYNPLVERAFTGSLDFSGMLARQMQNEMEILSSACSVSPDDLQPSVAYEGCLPAWKSSSPELFNEYADMLRTVRRDGFGIFRGCHMFTVDGTRIMPVLSADPIRMDQLKGYEWQRDLVMKNVRALLRGEPAADVLLYGDSGTGKSSTIKAAANELWTEGLRLIEVRPSQLHCIPQVLQELVSNPLRFILFIDDLSFSSEDDNFRALKGILEGSILSRARNVIVAATSNRRRLIRETFSDRAGDDVHANETIQQQTALSDRFGLSIPFMDPGRTEYLHIVEAAAKEAGLDIPSEELCAGAERFALEKGGRSGRAARQYVDQLSTGVITLP